MGTINLSGKEWLWFFYCKYYTIDGEEVKLPKNLCRFWWIAVFGFFVWVRKEAKLRYIWAATACSLLLVAMWANSAPAYLEPGIWWKILAWPVMFFWLSSLLGSVVIPGDRIIDYIKREKPRVVRLMINVSMAFAGVMVLAILGSGLADSEVRILLFQIFVGVLIAGISIVAITLVGFLYILPFLASMVPDRFLDDAEGSFWTTAAYFKAKKQRVCPLVNPPANFNPPE